MYYQYTYNMIYSDSLEIIRVLSVHIKFDVPISTQMHNFCCRAHQEFPKETKDPSLLCSFPKVVTYSFPTHYPY